MNKMQLGYPFPKIEEHFQHLFSHKDSEADGTHFVPSGKGQKQELVFNVPLDLPRYRLDNTRTLHHQQKYVTEKNLPNDYFEQDVWSDDLQNAQHSILKTLIDRQGLKEYFEKNQQTDPLILTHDGFVISGNRRLCAYRELYYNSENGEKKYKRFERVRVVILNKLTDEEIEFIEDYLEQQPDIKDEFSWISRAIGFNRRMKKHSYTTSKLAEKSGIKKNEIDSLIEHLTLADEFLRQIGKDGEYDLVEKDKYAFEQIEKGRKKYRHDVTKRDLFEKLSYIALEFKDKVGERMYKNIPIIQENLDEIEEEIQVEFQEDIEKLDSGGSENPIEELFEDDSETATKTIQLLDTTDRKEEIFDIVNDKIEEVKSLRQEKDKKKAVFKRIQKANTLLVEANNLKNHETDKSGISEQIAQIKNQIEELEKWNTK